MRKNDPHMVPIIGALLVAIFPQVSRIPPWISLWCCALWGYLLLGRRYGWPIPGRKVRLILTFFGFAGGVFTFRFSFNAEAGVGLLAIMVGLKPLEIRTHRDRMMTVFLTYFMVITNLLYSHALIMTLYMGISVLFTTAVLAGLNRPEGRFFHHLGLSARIMVQALPWMVALFVIFPRIHGSLWGSPILTGGRTGFTDRLEPGSVARIVQSAEIAFRAEFKGDIPERRHLYWRGMVFPHFDGIRWYRSKSAPRIQAPVTGSGPVEYVVTLEPHGRRWMFALDLPFYGQRPAMRRADHTLSAWRRIRGRIRYRVKSYTTYRTGPLMQWEKTARVLPRGGNERSRALAEKWSATAAAPEKIVGLAQDFFRKNRFTYTLTPPTTPSTDRIDDFLFRSRKGYCEHFASAFSFLMRAANIPARVVGGYLGGEVNPYGNYLIVRQEDAHAWVEVWLPGRGWVRVDPTSTVAPARIQGGATAALDPEERKALAGFFDLGPLKGYWKTVAMGWDMLNNRWNQYVMGYSYRSQQDLFSRIGAAQGSLKAPLAATLAVVAAALVMLAAVVLKSRLHRREKADAVVRAYHRFCEKLAAVGLPRAPSQGPLDYSILVCSARPDLAGTVVRLTRQYIRIRYGGTVDKTAVKAFVSGVGRFRPAKAP